MNNHTLTEPIPEETWRHVPGYGEGYAVSDQGRVISYRQRKPRMMSLHANPLRGNYLSVVLCNPETGSHDRMRIHAMVLLAFVGPRPDGMEIRHLDGNPQNNSLGNLAYGTKSENMQDTLRHGTHHHAAKTHCIRGHEFTDENTRVSKGYRWCRQCRRDKYANDPEYRAQCIEASRARRLAIV